MKRKQRDARVSPAAELYALAHGLTPADAQATIKASASAVQALALAAESRT